MTGFRRHARLLIMGALFWGGVAQDSHPAGLRGLADGWLLNGGDTTRVLAAGAPGVAEADSPSGFGFWSSAGQTRLYGMEDLPVVGLTVGAVSSAGGWRLGLAWERLGADLLREDDIEVTLSKGTSPRVGVRFRGQRWLVASYPAESHLDAALEIGWSSRNPGRYWELTLFWHPSEPATWLGIQGRRKLARFKMVPGGWGFAVALDLDAAGSPHLGFQGLAHLGAGLAVGLRADPSTGNLGPVLAWRGRSLLLRTCHTVHPVLGVTHRVTLGFGNAEAAPW